MRFTLIVSEYKKNHISFPSNFTFYKWCVIKVAHCIEPITCIMRVAVNRHALPVYKKNRITSLLCIVETTVVFWLNTLIVFLVKHVDSVFG